mmetsp:Transcript_95137/g.268795  ORF Transcript_95137/g.268795 Transcript_95137/m.268795 type:complete len:268 (+) Transcript_95137:85-888(+)|eukprot:CAMPEP_0117509434 /NCGR_PEP_ID=MMETSP0784-20121206/27472_1 /TAXON_ID=39447 /ORGANISM="" /LENGTH=267 /DNA_ID=CAMNT_0005305039 /DNA_START=62 /DNA_END=865 /DNA_ORIENTATION=+
MMACATARIDRATGASGLPGALRDLAEVLGDLVPCGYTAPSVALHVRGANRHYAFLPDRRPLRFHEVSEAKASTCDVRFDFQDERAVFDMHQRVFGSGAADWVPMLRESLSWNRTFVVYGVYRLMPLVYQLKVVGPTVARAAGLGVEVGRGCCGRHGANGTHGGALDDVRGVFAATGEALQADKAGITDFDEWFLPMFDEHVAACVAIGALGVFTVSYGWYATAAAGSVKLAHAIVPLGFLACFGDAESLSSRTASVEVVKELGHAP